jgi:predicted nucleotidyltransferase
MRLTSEQSNLITQVLAFCQPAVIYVFGSHGTQAQHPLSDIDLAFLPKSPVDAYQVFELANTLASQLGTDVDLIDLSRASTVMRKEVLRTGSAIEVDDEFMMRQFEMLALSDYARLNEERHEILAAY